MKHIVSFVCILSLLILSVPFCVSASQESQTMTFAQMHGYYRSLGRTLEQGTCLYMDNTASGFEVYFHGSGDVTLNATVMCNTESEIAQYLSVNVDGTPSRIRIACDQRNVSYAKAIRIASGLTQGDHHIEVYRQTEASVSLFCAESLTFTGHLLATAPEKPLTIDVIGDSISGGYGCLWNSSLGITSPGTNHPAYEDGTQTYAFLAGKALGADVRVTQTSGYGCVAGWNGRGVNLQTMYPVACYWRNTTLPYTFDPLADVVIINLGTNDYNTRNNNNLSNAEFKEGAKTLMQMARNYNPDAPVIWCTGMMGTFYQTELQEAVSELGGADAGYYFLVLPKGMGGIVSHPTAAQQATAGDVLKNFLIDTVLPAGYTNAVTTVAQLQDTIQRAQTVASPSAALRGAIARAETELAVGTTDPYRLYARQKAIEEAMAGSVKTCSLMPKEHITKAPVAADGISFVWPYYGNTDGSVSMYKGGGNTLYWPQLTTAYAQTIDIDETPYLRIEYAADASFNVSLTYRTPTGELAYVNAATLAGGNTTDLPPQSRGVLTLDFGRFIRENGHADSNGLVPLLYADLFVIGTTDQYVRLYECTFTDEYALPTAISGSYPVENGVLYDVSVGTTAADLLNAMDHADRLSVTDATGRTVSDALATGMILTLTVNGATADRAVIAVSGDINGDGDATTTDARLAILYALEAGTFDAAQTIAADFNKDNSITTMDARMIMLYALAN